MLSLNEIQLMAQLIDSIEKSAVRLESSYNQKNGKEFNSSILIPVLLDIFWITLLSFLK